MSQEIHEHTQVEADALRGDWHTYARTRARQEAEVMRQATVRAASRQHWFSEKLLPDMACKQDNPFASPRMTTEALATELLASVDRLSRQMEQLNKRLLAVEDYLTKP